MNEAPIAMSASDLDAAYAHCRALVRSHYENFTVASVFTPAPLRPYMWALYAYCRTVDDAGDEEPGDRLRLLDRIEERVRRCFAGRRDEPIYMALGDAVDHRSLPIGPFLALIDANRRDQDARRFATFDEILAYCEGSANSVGRLVLRIFGYDDEARDHLSDQTTTALQLVNFYQDLGRDWAHGRLYLPLNELREFGVDPAILAGGRMSDGLQALLRASYDRVGDMFCRGARLESMVEPSLARQLALYRLGGTAVLQALEKNLAAGTLDRPVLRGTAKVRIMAEVLLSRPKRDGS